LFFFGSGFALAEGCLDTPESETNDEELEWGTNLDKIKHDYI
jgi:hypothetical protein